MGKKKYTVHVENEHICTSYEVKAGSAAEAKLLAKEKFIKDFYNINKIKSFITSTDNI